MALITSECVPFQLGNQCAGTVVTVGSSVYGLTAGDRVVTSQSDGLPCCSTYAVAASSDVRKLTAGVSFVDAVSTGASRVKTFDMSEGPAAFWAASSGKHDRVVLTQVHAPTNKPTAIEGGTYLISGGYGGLGLEIVKWLMTKGVSHFVLVGRSGASAAAVPVIEEMEKGGASIFQARADISSDNDVRRVFSELRSKADFPPLAGVMHAAGVLDDGVVGDMSHSRLLKVMLPKADGARILHELTRNDEKVQFVMYSSITSLTGSAGQSNYAAANSYLDGLAFARVNGGLQGLAINWGPWSEVGMAQETTQRKWDVIGMGMIAPADGMMALEISMAGTAAQCVTCEFKYDIMLRKNPMVASSGIFAGILSKRAPAAKPKPKGKSAAVSTKSFFGEASAIADASQRESFVYEMVSTAVRGVLGLDPKDRIPKQKALKDMGVDSLMSVELRNSLSELCGETLPATLVFDYPSAEAITALFMTKVGDAPAVSAAARAPTGVTESNEPIAVVGAACRFPGGASGLGAFWSDVLETGKFCVVGIPPNRWDADAFYSADKAEPGKMNVKVGGFLQEDPAEFDATFFGIAPKEAISLDPQQRLLLEVTWESLENAAIGPEQVYGTPMGVFVGLATNDYSLVMANGAGSSKNTGYFATGSFFSAAVGRISYVLGMQGPCIAVDTACSSSLVATHMASQSLRIGECPAAIAGGAGMLLHPDVMINFSKAGMLSPNGRCATFDESADGYVRGEGAGMVVLKRLSAAREDANMILGTVRGSAVNQDGRSSGLTAPNGPSQESVISTALQGAGVAPSEVGYVEAHGTGTSLGDPIEVNALQSVYLGHSDAKPMVLGSVKTNIGHLEAGAGIAGLTKLLMCCAKSRIPEHLHFKQLNKYMNLDGTGIKVQAAGHEVDWPAGYDTNVGAVSSFGFGGTNSHVVVEQPTEEQPAARADDTIEHVFMLSAKTASSLAELCGSWARFLAKASPQPRLGDVCHTAAVGRSHLSHRFSVSVDSVLALVSELEAMAGGKPNAPKAHVGVVEDAQPPQVGLMFTGQGSQYSGMGKDLYAAEPVFRAAIDECNGLLEQHLDTPLLSILFPKDGSEKINQTKYTQPALFAFEYALAQLWISWGVEPFAVMGHSVGEYVAACVAGVFSLADGCKLISARAKLMDSVKADGIMAMVMVNKARVEKAIKSHSAVVSIAAVNGPEGIVVSGQRRAVEQVLAELKREGVRCVPLKTSNAFHSPLMDPILKEFGAVAAGIAYSAPKMTVVTNLTGKIASGDALVTPKFWVEHLRGAVLFESGVKAMVAAGCDAFLEVGPNPVCVGMARRFVKSKEIQWMKSLKGDSPSAKGVPEIQSMHSSVAALYCAAAPLNWRAVNHHAELEHRPLRAPTYAYTRSTYYVDVDAGGSSSASALVSSTPAVSKSTPLSGICVQSPFLTEKLFCTSWSTVAYPVLEDHVINDLCIVPAVFYMHMAIEAAMKVSKTGAVQLENVSIPSAMLLIGKGAKDTQLALTPAQVRDPTTWTILQNDGPNQFGL